MEVFLVSYGGFRYRSLSFQYSFLEGLNRPRISEEDSVFR